MKEQEERLLKLWKIRQEKEGVDVSDVKTLEEAKHFYDKPVKKNTKKAAKKEETPVVEDIEVTDPITEEEVQAVANAIVEQAVEDNKTIEEVVTDIVEETPAKGE